MADDTPKFQLPPLSDADKKALAKNEAEGTGVHGRPADIPVPISAHDSGTPVTSNTGAKIVVRGSYSAAREARKD